nr:hypothetical protein [Tanacetum cinerariifolium]
METPASIALVSCDGLGGYDWTDQAKEGPNYALMAYTSTSSDSKVSTDSTCTKSCLETVKTLKSHNEQLLKDLKKSELMVLGYKSGLDEFYNEPVVKNYDAKTRNMSYLTYYEEIDEGYVAFGGNPKGGKITNKGSECRDQEHDDNVNSTNNVNAASTNRVNVVSENISCELPFDPDMPALKDISTFNLSSDHKDDDEEADINNMNTTIQVSHVLTIRIHKDHPLDQVIRDLHSTTQIRNMSKNLEEHGYCDKKQSKISCSKHTQEEGIGYDELFAPVARIEAIRLFLAYASFKDFVVYQMDVKSDFLYEKIEKEVYVCQSPGFEDPYFPDKVYKVEKALYGLHQAPRVWYETLSTYFLDNGFHRGKIDKTLFIRRHKGGILFVQVYVDDIIFGSTKKGLCIAFEKMMHEKFRRKVKNASILIETQKPLLKDEDGEEVDVHMYRSMIDSLMYLTSSRPDIMFAVCACARYQVNLKVSHLYAMKKIFSSGPLVRHQPSMEKDSYKP